MNNVHFSSKTDNWATPQDLFDTLDKEFHFTLDPCASDFNYKVDYYYTQQQNGLIQDWSGERVFCNPPYGREIGKWVRKCFFSNSDVCVALLPARTDTRWFHDYILGKASIIFIRSRLKFGDSKNFAPFPSMICIWSPDHQFYVGGFYRG